MNTSCIDTVQLLLKVAPVVFASGRFAMKGGTALNLFVQDMPRLSVDIDVVYTDPTASRAVAPRVTGALASQCARRRGPVTRNMQHRTSQN